MNGRSLLISQQKQGGVLCTRSSGRSRGHAAKQLFDVLEARKQEVETLIHPVKGFVCYSLIRTTEGGVSVTVCEDKAGTEQSSQIARDWIGKNAADLGVNAPSIVEGSVILQLK